jgi:hypothetical protein
MAATPASPAARPRITTLFIIGDHPRYYQVGAVTESIVKCQPFPKINVLAGKEKTSNTLL